jgi:hypothetical protein
MIAPGTARHQVRLSQRGTALHHFDAITASMTLRSH